MSRFGYGLLLLVCLALFCGDSICQSQTHPDTESQEIKEDGESIKQFQHEYEQIPKPFIPNVDDTRYGAPSGQACEKQDGNEECGSDSMTNMASEYNKLYVNGEGDDKVNEQLVSESEQKYKIAESDVKDAGLSSESPSPESASYLDSDGHPGHRLLTIRTLIHSAIDYMFSPLVLVRKLLNNKDDDSPDDIDEQTVEAQTIMDFMADENQESVPVTEDKAGDDAVQSPTIDLDNDISKVNMNDTVDESNLNVTSPQKKLKFKCKGRNMTENSTHIASVKIVNGTELLRTLSFTANESFTDCIVVLFYAPWCPFCARAAPHYNALARAYPQIDLLAVDAAHFSNLNARFGTVSVPNILLFHQSRAVLRFNTTQKTFDTFVQFITNATGLEANTSVMVSEDDYLGPLSSVPSTVTDYYLWLSWVFVIICGSYIFTVSRLGKYIVTRIQILWQEHQHIQ